MASPHRTAIVSRVAVGVLVVSGLAWLVYSYTSNRGDVRVDIVEVSGFTDNVRIWMPFRLQLRLTNAGARATTVRRIDVEPDLEGFNEAYSSAAPYDLSPPILLEAGAASNYEAALTLLNAAQLAERAYPLIFRVRLETDDGDVTAEFPADFHYTHEPARRALRPRF